MLINKGPTVGEVVTIKLTSGEELLGTLREDGATIIKVSKLRVLTSTKEGIGMMPFVVTADPDQDCSLNKSVVVLMEPTDKEFASSYTKAVSGIIV